MQDSSIAGALRRLAPGYRPAVDLPILAMFIAVMLSWTWIVVLGWRGALPPAVAVPVIGLIAYAGFTVMHECVHGNMFRRAWLNALVGNVASVVLGPTSCFRAYRYLHFEHHRHTNDRQRDPDYWSGGIGPWWLLPFAWLTTDFYYYYFYLRQAHTRPWAERIEIFAVSGAFSAAAVLAWWLGYGAEVLLYWLLPGRIAIVILSIAFNYLPHVPYKITAAQDVYRATRMLAGAEWIVTPVFMFHNYHVVHHLFPATPFYRYPGLWREQRDELVKRGVAIARIAM